MAQLSKGTWNTYLSLVSIHSLDMESRDVGLSWHPLCQPNAKFLPSVFHAKDLPRYRLPSKCCACQMVQQSVCKHLFATQTQTIAKVEESRARIWRYVKYLRQPLKLCPETSCRPSRFLLPTLTSPGPRTGNSSTYWTWRPRYTL